MDVLDRVRTIIFNVEEKTAAAMVIADKVVVNLPSGNKVTGFRGEKLEAPYWMLRILEKRNLVRLEEPSITINDILRVHHDETHKRSSRELSALPDNFYFRARRFLERLAQMVNERPTPELVSQLTQAERLLNEVVEKRLTTILYIAISGRGEDQILGKMSPEEEALYRWVRSTIESWRGVVLGGGAER